MEATSIKQLRDMRASLPMGKKDPWGKCCPNKRVLLHRALKKDDIGKLTIGEYGVVEEFLAHCAKVKKENERFAETIAKIAEP